MNSQPKQMSPEARRAGLIWGLTITGCLALVVVVNLYVAWLASGEDAVTMVSPSYYQDALDYDHKIQAGDRAQAIDLRLNISENGQIALQAESAFNDLESIIVHYYRPSDPGLDYHTTARRQGDGKYLPEQLPPQSGRWDVTVEFKKAGQILSASHKWFYETPGR